MSLLNSAFRLVNRVFPATIVHAHCDIPCGIYDPHTAQVSALTAIRMSQLLQNLKMPGPASTPAEVNAYAAEASRLTATKEQHAELCKHELRILWGDYFKPEHLQQVPDLHDKFWKALKLASAVRQKNDLKTAEDLLAAVQQIAEAFWKTKGAKTAKQPSRLV
ncbi:MAG: superoxide dismutase, Ni [Chloroflexota bacterium]